MDIYKLQPILKYSIYAVVAWILSWVIFFLILPVMITMFGKLYGTAVNYAITWVTSPLIIIVLNYIKLF